MSDRFVHLHNHSHYSLLDGFASPACYAVRAAKFGQPALALTDHGAVGGAYKHWKECTNNNIKPIIGVEAYVSPGEASDRTPIFWGTTEQRRMDVGGGGRYTHLTILARSGRGLRGIYRGMAEAYRRGFYGKARFDRKSLSDLQDVIVLSGCAGSELSTRLRLRQDAAAEAYVREMREIFGDSFFIEMMSHDIEEDDLSESELNGWLKGVADSHGLGVVATNDCHYAAPDDATGHEAFLCIQTQTTLDNPKRFKLDGGGFYLKSRAEMDQLDLPVEALDNTLIVADMVESYDELFTKTLRMPEVVR